MVSILFEWLTLLTLSLALLFGGSRGWLGERLLALPALVLIVVAVARIAGAPHANPARRAIFCLLPALLLMVPALQLIPLPFVLWSQLPSRGTLALALDMARVPPGWHPLSVTPLLTERAFESLLVPAGLFMAAVTLNGAQRRRLVVIALTIAAVNVLLGLSQILEGPDSSLYFYAVSNRDDAVGFFANRNHLASLLATAVPVTLGMLMDRLRRTRHGERDLRVWLANALIVLLAVGATATRARVAYLMLILCVLAACAVGWRARQQGHHRRTAGWMRLGAVLAAFLIAQFTLFAVLQRLQSEPADDLRGALRSQTLQLAVPAKGLGFGIGSFPLVYNQLGDEVAGTRAYVNHTHNDYAELWLEGGVPALLLAVAALAALGWQIRRQWRALRVEPGTEGGPRGAHRGLELGAAFALLLLALHSAIDYPLRTLALQAWAALLVAVLVGSVHPGQPVSR